MRAAKSRLGLIKKQSTEEKTFCFVVATRLPESKFWKQSPTGLSLQKLQGKSNVRLHIHHNNKKGLGEIYAAELIHVDSDYLVFLHDDVWLMDEDLLEIIHVDLSVADIIGVAGTRRRHPRQPAWLFSKVSTGGGFVWDYPNLSGSVGHGDSQRHEFTNYGTVGQRCKLLDGVFMAINAKRVKQSEVNFSKEFDFHFYDMDFCRSADRQGLWMKTSNIRVIHSSSGAFGTESWWSGYRKYLSVWGS
jgi:hypothetical protein